MTAENFFPSCGINDTPGQVPAVKVMMEGRGGGRKKEMGVGRENHWLGTEPELQLRRETAHESAVRVPRKGHMCSPMKKFIPQM